MIKQLVLRMMPAVLAAAVVAFAVVGPASAAAGPDQATTPTGEWTELAAGATTWYAFDYLGDGSQIDVWLDAVPSTGATLSVWTPDNLATWMGGGAVEPVGRGTDGEFAPGDLSWSGNFNRAGRYYLVLDNSGAETTYYALHIAGAGVSATGVAETTAEATASGNEAPASAAAAAEASHDTSGATPGQPYSIPAYTVTIDPAATLWHAFQYAGDQSQILVWLDNVSGSSVSFAVWTPEQIGRMEKGNAVDPVGRGSSNEYGPGSQSWSGNFMQGGSYYVSVTNHGGAVATYTAMMQGTGVW